MYSKPIPNRKFKLPYSSLFFLTYLYFEPTTISSSRHACTVQCMYLLFICFSFLIAVIVPIWKLNYRQIFLIHDKRYTHNVRICMGLLIHKTSLFLAFVDKFLCKNEGLHGWRERAGAGGSEGGGGRGDIMPLSTVCWTCSTFFHCFATLTMDAFLMP